MKGFIEIIRVTFKFLFQYKWTFAITVITQPFALLINMSLFQSIYVYNQTDIIKGYGYEQMVWYFLSFMIINCFVWNPTTSIISNKILSGNLSSDLLKPISLINKHLWEVMAARLIALIMDFLPTMLICSLILFPHFITAFSLLRFLAVVLPAFLINYFFAFLLGMLAMALKNNSSLDALRNLLVAFIGGAFIPLEFFPSNVNLVFSILPFKYIYYWPIQFFLNKSPADSWYLMLKIILIQFAWIVVLYLLCKFIWWLMIRKYCAAGG